VDDLYSIKRKKYKTVCAELAFAKSSSTAIPSIFYIDKTGSTEKKKIGTQPESSG
jgi:hypothetical protein